MEPYRTAPDDAPLCPRCRSPLARAEHEGEELLGCVSCHGFFVDLESLSRIIERHRPTTAAPPSQRPPVSAQPVDTRVVYLACPRCGSSMNRAVFGRKSGVIVDTCKMHGTWFDARELEACEAFVDVGGLAVAERVAREEKEAVKREARVAQATAQFVVRRTGRGGHDVEDRDWSSLVRFLKRL